MKLTYFISHLGKMVTVNRIQIIKYQYLVGMQYIAPAPHPGAGALLGWVVVIAAGTRVHRRDEHEAGGILHAVFGTRYDYRAVL